MSNSQSSQDEEDNKVVDSEDLNSEHEEVTNIWSNKNTLNALAEEMAKLSKVKFNVEQIPEKVIIKAIAEVLSNVGWTSIEGFHKTIDTILYCPPRIIPFSIKAKDKNTGKNDFWILRTFIDIKQQYEVDGKKYNKQNILMSRQFCNSLREYCRTELNDRVQFWTFTGSYTGKQNLDMTKLSQSDIKLLDQMFGETNPRNLVMFQFKKKVPEVYIKIEKSPVVKKVEKIKDNKKDDDNNDEPLIIEDSDGEGHKQ